MRALRCALFSLVLAAVACGGGPTVDATGEWVGTVTTEGNVTTVSNEAGSKWGGMATLVEEASIGVETGTPEYMFGSVSSLFATDDTIYVVETQPPSVRVYDWDGNHIRSFGREGQGPGEFVFPGRVLVDDQGRIFVGEGAEPRINIFSSEGEVLDTWSWSSAGVRITASTLVMTLDGRLFTRARWFPEGEAPGPDNQKLGMQEVNRDGPIGEPLMQPDLEVERLWVGGTGFENGGRAVPHGPHQVSAFSPTGAYIVGDNSDYAFEIRYPDGRIVKVQRYWEPTPISDELKAYERMQTTASARRQDPNWSWSGADIPDHKPAYYSFYPTQGTRVLVVRYGVSRRIDEPCEETLEQMMANESIHCYEPDRMWDMFDLEGNFLGEIERPSYTRLFSPFWRDDTLLLQVEDEDGTVMVKRFRLQVPTGVAGAPQ